MKYGRQLVES